MATSLCPCPNCGRMMDASRSVCVFCQAGGQTIQDATILQRPPSPSIEPASSRGPILIAGGIIGVAAVLAAGIFLGSRLAPKPKPTTPAAMAPSINPQQQSAAQRKAAADAEAMRQAQWRNEGLRLKIQGEQARKMQTANPTPAASATTQPQQSSRLSPAQKFGFLDEVENAYQRAEAAARQGERGKLAVADFNSRIKAGKIAMDATMEKEGISLYTAPPEIQHAYKCISAYETAGRDLENYTTLGTDYWLIEASSAHAEAQSERNALNILSQ